MYDDTKNLFITGKLPAEEIWFEEVQSIFLPASKQAVESGR